MKTILQYLQYIFKSSRAYILFTFCFSGIGAFAQTSSFTVQFDYKCAPTVVTITNTSSSGAGYEYLWDFGKGAIIPSDEMVLYEAYTQSGSYTITLAVVNGSDTVRSSQEISIATGPKAAFSADQVEGCVPHTVSFSDGSTAGDGAISEVFWDFREGQTRIGQTVDYTYNSEGTHDVFMRVTDVNGCTSYTETPDLVDIHPIPIVNFSASDSSACNAPLTVNFMNLSSGSGELQSFWNYGNGSTSTSFSGSALYTEDGNYRVSLLITDENNCTDSLVMESFINIGTQTGELYALINGEPVFDPNIQLCQGSIIFGSTLPTQADYKWIVNYNDELQIFQNVDQIEVNLPDSGNIDLTLLYGQASECPDSISKSYHIDYVKANFELDKQYACSLPIDVTLTNTSENYDEIMWFLPDGSTSNLDTISKLVPADLNYAEIYNHEVNYKSVPFTLIVTNENNCRDTLIKEMEVELPVARFMPDVSSGCIPFDVVFHDSSRSVETIIEWEYLIDGQVFTQNSNDPLSYTFSTPGIYEVSQVITNNMGCRDTSYSVEIRAGEKLDPQMDVDPAAICFGDAINLNSNTPPANMVDSWQYASDGLFNTGTLSAPGTSVIVYPSFSGSKDVHLSIESNYCVSDTTYEDAFTAEAPAGYFDFQFSCDSPLDYTFVSRFENADGLLWTIGTDVFTDIDSFQYNFSGTGDFTVTLVATNSLTGCSVSKSRTVKVRSVDAAFSVKPVLCAGVETEFNASGSIDYINECYIEGFLWDFDDNLPPRRNYNPVQNHTYFAEGEYFPKLIVTADNGCTDTMEAFVRVVFPSADFSADPKSGCGPDLEVNFNYDGLDATISSWEWIFGDKSRDSLNNPNPVHQYHSPFDANFIATLVANDEYGCQNYSQQLIHISMPDAGFQAIDPGLCLGQEAVFIPSDPGLDNYQWNYGDGSPPGSQNTHLYDETGTFSVSLTVEKDGCISSTNKQGYISVEQADASYTISDSVPDCYPAPITFNHTGLSGEIVSGIWIYQPGVQSSEYDPITEYTYSAPGIYITSLSIQTTNNCVASASKIIEVSGPEVEYIFTPSSICSGDTVSFNILRSEELDEFEWIFGDGNVSTEDNPSHVYIGNGTLYPALRVVKDDCEVTLSNHPLRIYNPVADFVILGESEIQCFGTPWNTRNHSSQYNSSIWSVDGYEVSNSSHLVDYYFQQPGEHVISLKILNNIGCTDSTSRTIEAASLPTFQIYGDTTVCLGKEPAQLQVDEQPGWNISWEPESLLNNAAIFNPLAQPPVTTQFFATVVDANSCTGTENIMVYVEQEPNINRIPISDTSITIGESIQLFIQSDKENTEYNWSPSYSISCVSCQNPIVNPDKDFTYTVVVQDECFELSYDFNIEVIINFYLEVPQAFTPNGDGENDIFNFEANNVSEVDFKIFNRWGNLVFSTQDLIEGWDGRYNGKLQNPDTYTYYIRATSNYGYEFEKKGTFLLLR